jgi:hypothetical protein
MDVPPANQFFAVKLQYPSNNSERGLSKHVVPGLEYAYEKKQNGL